MPPFVLSIASLPLTSLLRPILGDPSGPLTFETRALRGGLDSAGVTHVTVRFERKSGRSGSRRFVVKRLRGTQVREARVYRELLPPFGVGNAPALEAVHEENGECWLFLEPVRRINNWPWRESSMPAKVLRALAELHTAPRPALGGSEWLAQWDYETELAARSYDLIAVLQQLPNIPAFAHLRDGARAVRRLARDILSWREWLMERPSFERTFIHGDAHPGNVIMRKTRKGPVPVFVDWGRARIGSPLEDVSSWLQSLGFWEPTAKRRHDSLLLAYIEARGLPRHLGRELRDAYWLAAASNLLAGAILYHLAVLTDPTSSERQRGTAFAAAADGLRVIRRADACWRWRVK